MWVGLLLHLIIVGLIFCVVECLWCLVFVGLEFFGGVGLCWVDLMWGLVWVGFDSCGVECMMGLICVGLFRVWFCFMGLGFCGV